VGSFSHLPSSIYQLPWLRHQPHPLSIRVNSRNSCQHHFSHFAFVHRRTGIPPVSVMIRVYSCRFVVEMNSAFTFHVSALLSVVSGHLSVVFLTAFYSLLFSTVAQASCLLFPCLRHTPDKRCTGPCRTPYRSSRRFLKLETGVMPVLLSVLAFRMGTLPANAASFLRIVYNGPNRARICALPS
jgi:DMSO reductase anchor subunit